jgi:hypothetical protein
VFSLSRLLLAAVVLAGLTALGGAFWLGRKSAGVMASESATSPGRALLDPASKYTVRLIQYEGGEANLARAHATAEHLRERCGVPVHGPYRIGKALILCAGQAPKVADLEPLLKRVRPLPGPPPQERSRPFASAYVVNIDDVLERD